MDFTTAETVAERVAVVAPTRAEATPWTDRWRLPLAVLVILQLALVFGPTVLWLFDRWTMSVWQNAHGMLVAPFAGWMAWQQLKGRTDVPLESSRWGYVFLVPALLLHAIDAGIHTQLLSAVALIVALAGLSLLLLGAPRTRLIAFPLIFLVFALPIPLGFTEPLQLVLRKFAAHFTATLLPWLGVNVFLEGTILHTTAGRVSISDACSGFSTLYAAVTAATLLAYAAESRFRAAAVLVAAVPVAVLSNVLRVLALTLMVAWGEGWLLDTFVHPLSGMLTFALALPALMWLGGRAAPART